MLQALRSGTMSSLIFHSAQTRSAWASCSDISQPRESFSTWKEPK